CLEQRKEEAAAGNLCVPTTKAPRALLTRATSSSQPTANSRCAVSLLSRAGSVLLLLCPRLFRSHVPSPAHTTARCVLSSVPQQSPWIHLYKQESLAIRLAKTTGAGAARFSADLPVVAVVDSARLSPTAQVKMKGRKGAAKSDDTPVLFPRLRSPSKSLLSTNHSSIMSCSQ
ncbi:unnamed protein product, partial [Ectocarpus sp. 6 AP-2014]